MPTVRGNLSEDTYPDTKIPRAIFPEEDNPDGHELNSVIVMLNLGEYDSSRHYAAIAKIQQLGRYVLFFRQPGGTWTIRNMRPLKTSLDDSLYMLDSNKTLHRLIEKVTGLKQKGKSRRKTIRKYKKKRSRRSKIRTLKRKRTRTH
jgi:hypothetical protein